MEAAARRERPPLTATAESPHCNHGLGKPDANKHMGFPQQTEPQGLAHTGQERVCLLLEGKGKGQGRKAELAPAGTGTGREGSPSETVLSLACLRASSTGQGLCRDIRATGPSPSDRDAFGEPEQRSACPALPFHFSPGAPPRFLKGWSCPPETINPIGQTGVHKAARPGTSERPRCQGPGASSHSGRPPCGPREVGVRAPRGHGHGGGGFCRESYSRRRWAASACRPREAEASSLSPRPADPSAGSKTLWREEGAPSVHLRVRSPPGCGGADSSCFGPCQDSRPMAKREEVIPDFPLSPAALGLNPRSSTHSGSRGWAPDRAKPQHVMSVNWGETQTSQAGCRGFSGGDCTSRQRLAQAHQHSRL